VRFALINGYSGNHGGSQSNHNDGGVYMDRISVDESEIQDFQLTKTAAYIDE
jgi:hypothetical protein